MALAEIAETQGSLWVRDRIIGTDSWGFVYLAKNRDPNLPPEIVVKSVQPSWTPELQFEKELLCNLQSGPCSNVLRRCYGDEITTTKSGKKVYNILLEYCASTLYDHIAKFGPNGLPELEVRRYTRDIVRGLCYLHCNARYIHCNINAKSILLSPTGSDGALMARIANLESAKELTSQVPDCDARGSYLYMSPELKKKGYLGTWMRGVGDVDRS